MANLRLNNISFCYEGAASLLENISFKLAPGKMTALLGPNGIGKTTLLNLMCRVLTPKSGTLSLDDQAYTTLSLRETAKKMAYVPQVTHPTFSLTVFEYVLLGRAPHLTGLSFESKKDIDLATTCLKEMDALKFKDRDFHTLSGGEKQRVLLAKALCQQPQILLLDEPTAHLDLKSQVQLLSYVKKLQQTRNLTVFLVLHNIELAAEFCDEVIFLKNKKIAAQGPTRDMICEKNLQDVFDISMAVDQNPYTHNLRITYRDLNV